MPLKKFTALDREIIAQIIDGDIAINKPLVAKAAKNILSQEKYEELLRGYRYALDGKKVTEFVKQNELAIFSFLNECGVIGFVGESQKTGGDHIIGAEGVSLVSSYMKTKPKYSKAHQVITVKNENLVTAQGLRKHADIFLAQQGFHSALYQQLMQDLSTETEEFNRSYLVETFGTTGGNHFVCLTIRKKLEDESPLIDFFDPSPSLVKNGLEAAENSIANGWCSHLIINATLKKLFADLGMAFDLKRYFNNSEPLQASGFNYCATFASEMAYRIATMSYEEHQSYLEENFQYRSPFGGRTELVVDLDEIEASGGYWQGEDLKLAATEMTHFVETAIIPRHEKLAAKMHQRKDGAEESILERVARNQNESGNNDLPEQKALRQRIHLFEIITDESFLALGEEISDEEFQKHEAQKAAGNPYFSHNPNELSLESRDLALALNNILPRTNRVNCANYDEATKSHNIAIYIGQHTEKKLATFMQQQKIEYKSEIIDLSENFTEVDERVAKLCKAHIKILESQVGDLIALCKETAPLYNPKPHPFMPPQRATKAKSVASLLGKTAGHEFTTTP